MSSPGTDTLQSVKDLVEQISVELVFAEAGSDVGLLPINCHVGDLNAIVETGALPLELAAGIAESGQIVDRVFDSGAEFSDETLNELSAWLSWAQKSIIAMEGGGIALALETPSESSRDSTASSSNAATTNPDSGSADAGAIHLKLEEDGELLVEFINESREHLQNIEAGVLELEENPTDSGTINSIFRAFHTFKGGAGFLNLLPIRELAHRLEDLLDRVRDGTLQVDAGIITLILKGGDTLGQFVGEIDAQLTGETAPSPIRIPIGAQRDELDRVLNGEQGEQPKTSIPNSEADTGPAEEPTAEFESPDAAANTDSPAPKAVPVEAPTSTGRSSKKSSGNSGIASVKVTTSKLDDLVNLVGEIVVAQSMVESDAQQTAEDSDRRSRNFSLMRRATRELQRVAMSMRMVPIQSCFMKMKRLVRDMAGRIGKEVELVMEGEDTELDRNIVEQIGDPLIHMVSNSLDHGIELPDRREETGKSRRGTIHLSARHQGGNIIIEIRDDGAGLDRERILQKAMENGIISDPSILTDREVYELVFAAGFSTAEAVTELSGRGVGMDVVRRNIESLHGKVEIDSQPGRSSVFSIHLPLTLAIIDGMLVTVGKQTFIIPTMTVRESMRITPDMVSDFRGRGELVDVRGQLIPLLRLYDRFGIEPRNTNPADGIVVVIESGQDVRCVLVDELIGKQEIVIKSLGDLFSSNRSLAGAAILGDGRVGLILDINTIVSPVETDFRIAA